VQLRLEPNAGRFKGAALCRALGARTAMVSGVQDGGRVALSFPASQGAIEISCELLGDRLEGTAIFRGTSGECALRRRRPTDAAAFDHFRGDYELEAGRVLYVGRYDTANNPFLADGDLRAQIVPVGEGEFLVEDLRSIRFETGDGGAAVAALVTEPGREPRRAPRVRPYGEEPVAFANGGVRLAGTLTVPAGPGPHPAIVFVHGSGPGPRESYAVEADRFAREGIATLAYDKRGSGASTGDWRQVGFDELAEDVLAGVRFLRQDKRIRADQVGLFGISQAGWIIPLAASRSPDVAFLVPVSGAAVTPAEQELWRQRQNLQYLGVPVRFIEAERKSTAMAYDWQWRFQSGLLPLPNPFADDNLNMFHDAPAVLRRVRQPVLAVLGGLDTLTPPRESAALWADALRQRGGNDDFSVRLFPRGSHGLYDGGKTGSPLEVFPETRWVPGYIDTVVRWVRHHTGGPKFPDARRVDVDPDDVPVQSRGMHRVGWYGSGAVQPWFLLAWLVVFTLAAVAAPSAWLWRRVRRAGGEPSGPARVRWLAALLGLVNVAILIGMTAILYRLVQTRPDPVIERLGLFWNVLVAATWLSLGLGALVALGCVAAWRHGWWSRAGRVGYTLVALAAAAWVPFVVYWDLVRPVW
jgi:dienelactone hydrolase